MAAVAMVADAGRPKLHHYAYMPLLVAVAQVLRQPHQEEVLSLEFRAY
jgi:hypothetical protein